MTAGVSGFGGDKLGFEVVEAQPEYAPAQEAFRKVVETARRQKRAMKDVAELKKEKALRPHDIVNEALRLAHLDYNSLKANRLHLPNAKDLRESRVHVLVAERKLAKELLPLALEIVNSTPTQEIASAKAILKEYHALIGKLGWDWKEIQEMLARCRLTVQQVSPTNAWVLHPDGTRVGQVWIGASARLKAKPGEQDDVVLTQRGYDAAKEFEKRRKEYVLDKNSVPTRRYVTRGINYKQLGQMLGMEWDKVDQKFKKDAREAGQRARSTEPDVFGNHASTLDLSSAAVGRQRQDPDRYPEVGAQSEALPISGVPAHDATTTIRPGDRTDHNERTSLQVRNGSGDDQPMLSAAAIQERLSGRVAKIVRGNKGERFDRSNEGVAVVEIDLAEVKRAGVTFVNVHSEDSHQYKVAYARFAEAKDGTIKRDARAELDEYIYSGRKNREVVLDSIPNRAISGITLVGNANWEFSGLPVGTKLDLKANLDKIAAFMTDARLARLVAAATALGRTSASL